MEAAQFTIADVAALLKLQTVTRGDAPAGTFNVVCPYCGDTRGKCNMVLSRGNKHNIFNCFHCGAKGNMISLYVDQKGLSGKDAARQAYIEISSQLEVGGYSMSQYQPRAEAANTSELESDEVLDRTYRKFLSYLTLEGRHKRDLLNRGLTEKQIDTLCFRSTCGKEQAKSICRRLIREGYVLKGVPGFFQDRDMDWTVNFYAGNRGYLCPVHSTNGHLIGFQIRVDDPKDAKYLWLTSTGRENGVSSGSPATFFGNKNCTEVYVTEGILKAAITHCISRKPIIGIAGVNNLKYLVKTLKELPNVTTVYEAMDMDAYKDISCLQDHEKCGQCRGATASGKCPYKKKTRSNVRRGCESVMKACQDNGYKVEFLFWDYHLTDKNKMVWDGNFKGIDDWLAYQKELRRERKKGDVE